MISGRTLYLQRRKWSIFVYFNVIYLT